MGEKMKIKNIQAELKAQGFKYIELTDEMIEDGVGTGCSPLLPNFVKDERFYSIYSAVVAAGLCESKEQVRAKPRGAYNKSDYEVAQDADKHGVRYILITKQTVFFIK